MSVRSGRSRVLVGLSVAVVALVPACSGGDAGAPADPTVTADPSVTADLSALAPFSSTFEVESPIQLVAGEERAWILTSEGSGAALSRIDHTGRSDEVLRLPGSAPGMAPYRDGVVVARVACDAEDCEETAVRVLVLDAAGSTVAEAEFAREAGGIERSQGVRLIGVQEDVVWLDTSDGLIGHDLATGQTVSRTPWQPGVICVLSDGLYTLVPLDRQYFGHGGLSGPGIPDPRYDVEMQGLVDGEWTSVPDSIYPLTDQQIQLATCKGGGVDTGSSSDTSPVWSPTSGWVDRGPYLTAVPFGVAPEPTASGQGDQVFVLQRAGVMRRLYAGADGPLTAETLDVPADIFVQQPFDPGIYLQFDRSPTVATGCVQQPEAMPAAECWIGSIDE